MLSLSNNPLNSSSISSSISPLSALRELYLDAIDNLRLTPFTFSPLQRTSLRLLSVRDTNLGDANFWPTLDTLAGLETVIASGCGLVTIPDYAFRRSAALQTIDLRYNYLGPTLSERQLSGLSATNLRSLRLDTNLISVVDWCALVGFPSEFLFQLGLAINPLRCSDCSLVLLLARLRSVDDKLAASLEWTCADGSFFGLQSATVPDWCTSNASSTVMNCSETIVALPEDGFGAISGDRLLTLNVCISSC